MFIMVRMVVMRWKMRMVVTVLTRTRRMVDGGDGLIRSRKSILKVLRHGVR